jgi:hypothetical protein
MAYGVLQNGKKGCFLGHFYELQPLEKARKSLINIERAFLEYGRSN